MESEIEDMKDTADNRRGKRRLAGAVFALLLAAAGAQTAFAGQWEAQEDGGFKYQEDGAYLTEWHQIDGIWYYFDPDTGVWAEKPELTQTAACHLLENAVNRAGWYQNETFPVHYRVDSAAARKMTVSVLLETAPDQVTSTLGVFEIDRRNGTAKELSTKIVLDLYAYQ